MLIEFFFCPDILSIQEGSASPIVRLDWRGKSSILDDNGCPKKHTQILPLTPQDGTNVGRVAVKNIQTLEGKDGANYTLLRGGGGGGSIENTYFFFNSKYLFPKEIWVSIPKHGQHRREAVFLTVRHF